MPVQLQLIATHWAYRLLSCRAAAVAVAVAAGVQFRGPLLHVTELLFVSSVLSVMVLYVAAPKLTLANKPGFILAELAIDIAIVVLFINVPGLASVPVWLVILGAVGFLASIIYHWQKLGCAFQTGASSPSANLLEAIIKLFPVWMFIVGFSAAVSLLDYSASEHLFFNTLGLWSVLGLLLIAIPILFEDSVDGFQLAVALLTFFFRIVDIDLYEKITSANPFFEVENAHTVLLFVATCLIFAWMKANRNQVRKLKKAVKETWIALKP